jgi:hypothetical protein
MLPKQNFDCAREPQETRAHMQGIFFTEFVAIVETQFSLRIADAMLERSRVASGGAYTTVGTYDVRELHALVRVLSELTGRTPEQLLTDFGRGLVQRLARSYPAFLRPFAGTFAVLTRLREGIFHEVLKLHPDIHIPDIEVEVISPTVLRLAYRSPGGLAPLALGMLQGCSDHYGESLHIELLEPTDAAYACFLLSKPPA